MILSVTFSKPVSQAAVLAAFNKPYTKIKIKLANTSQGAAYFAEFFTKTQVFHQHFTETELNDLKKKKIKKTFKNCVQRTQSEEITLLSNNKGKITELKKPLKTSVTTPQAQAQFTASAQRPETAVHPGTQARPANSATKLNILPPAKKNYLLKEGVPVPFLVILGVMTSEGKVIASRYDKFRQINRFLEFINDILPSLRTPDENEPLRIIDFGCGKSYLTFAVHYFLTEILHLPCQIEGLDLKQDVIDYCNDMAGKLNLKGLVFHKGDIASYSGTHRPDIVITLHACDTATDFALKYAVERGARAILSVPCCQHQVNSQLPKAAAAPQEFSPLLKWGIIKEKFASLVTDALRGEWLEKQGYKVQMLEFIDMEHTPKNILIRAVRLSSDAESRRSVQGSANAPDSSPASQSAVSGSAALPAAPASLPQLAQKLDILPEIFK